METNTSKWAEVAALVQRAQTGDRAAFGELVERFQANVMACARSRQKNPEAAADLVQEVFLHAMRKIGQLRKPECFGAWLNRIADRIAINRATRRPSTPTVDCEVLEQQGPVGLTPLEDLVRREQRQLVRQAVASLRSIDREALVAFYLQGKSLATIADEQDLPIGTVKRRLHVARQRLEEHLRTEGKCVPVAVGADEPIVADEAVVADEAMSLATETVEAVGFPVNPARLADRQAEGRPVRSRSRRELALVGT